MNIDIYVRRNLKTIDEMVKFVSWMIYPEMDKDSQDKEARTQIRRAMEKRRKELFPHMEVKQFVANQVADIITDLLARSLIRWQDGMLTLGDQSRISAFIQKNGRWKWLTIPVPEQQLSPEFETVILSRKVVNK